MSCFTGSQVYQHGTRKGRSSTPTAASPEKSQEQPGQEEREKRRRRPPGNWWKVEGSSNDVESGSSQPEWFKVKRSEERKKRRTQIKSSRLNTPQNGNVSISPIPPEGTPTPLLRAKPTLTPKSLKRSLATFKDIITSATETPAIRGCKETVLNNKRMVTSSPAVEIAVTECAATVISMDAGDSKSSSNQKPPENSNNQLDNL